MFAIDYPYEDTFESTEFIRTAPLPDADLEKIAHINAERVFRIAPRSVQQA
jgi:predicted TIM-barrel fold metal-dependent hydrolase